MINFTDILERLRTMESDYKINIISIRQFENTDVCKTDVKQVFDAHKTRVDCWNWLKMIYKVQKEVL